MKAMIAVGLVLVAALGVAGGARAFDDCAAAPTPGFYTRVCLFHDHAGSPRSWNTPVMVWTSEGGPYPGHDICQYAPGPATYTRACVDQSTYDAMSCSGGACTGYRSGGTTALAHAGGAFGEVYVAAQQGAGEQRGSWGEQRTKNTEVSAQWSGKVAVQVQQQAQDGTYGHSCGNYVYARTAAGPHTLARPCAEATPAGSVDTELPMLHQTCAAGVCGTFPDWPDGMGLPFL